MTGTLELVADIGASNARFAVLSDGERRSTVLRTAEFDNAVELIRQACGDLAVEHPTACCVAMAGPVVQGAGQITNASIRLVRSELEAELGCSVRLVNDFYALAMAVPHLQQLTRVGGKAGSGVKAVIGPGSGLGMSILIPAKSGGYEVMNSEGGHADLAPGNPLELEVLGILLQQHREACWESVLSGPGLVRLYSAIVQIWGGTAEFTRPEEISAHGVDAQDPICHQTLELFFGWLGAAAGNLALTVCATGGVYIGGGIVPALEQFALTSPLRRRFEERVGLTDFIRDIPVYIIMDPDPGLIGAAACLHAKAAKP